MDAAKPHAARRFTAFFIDSVVAGGVFGLLVWAVNSPAGYVLGALAGGGSYLVRDGLTVAFIKRRSLGKRLAGLRPVRLDAEPASLLTSVKRNWMFSAVFLGALPVFKPLGELLALSALVVIVYEGYRVLTDAEARRWGDELAGTRVIESAD